MKLLKFEQLLENEIVYTTFCKNKQLNKYWLLMKLLKIENIIKVLPYRMTEILLLKNLLAIPFILTALSSVIQIAGTSTWTWSVVLYLSLHEQVFLCSQFTHNCRWQPFQRRRPFVFPRVKIDPTIGTHYWH